MNKVTIAVVPDGMDLTDAQWMILAPLLPTPRLRRDSVAGRGAIRGTC